MKRLAPILLSLLLVPIASSAQTKFQTGHTHDISEVKFSPDDSQLISYSVGDGRLCLWNVRDGSLVWMSKTGFIQRTEESYNLEEFYWSVDGKYLVTKSRNNTFQTWEIHNGTILSVTEAKPEIELIAPNKKNVSISRDYSDVTVSDNVTKSNKQITSFGTNSTFDTSNDGAMIAEGGGWGDASIRLTEIKTGRSWWLDGHPSVIKAIAYSPDGNSLAVGGSDKSIYIFDAATRALSRKLVGHTKPITAIAFSPDGQTLVSGEGSEQLKVWQVESGRFLQDLAFGDRIHVIKQIDFSKNGDYLLVMSETSLQLWNARTLKVVHTIATKEGYELNAGEMTIGYTSVPVSTALFSSDGKRILSSHADGTLRGWDVMSGRQVTKLKVVELLFAKASPDGKTILAVAGKSGERRIKILDCNNGRVLTSFDKEETDYLEALAISSDGKRFATSDVGGDVLLWDVTRHKPIHKLDIGFSGDDAIAFSPDGKTLVVGGRNQNLFLFDVASGKAVWQLISSYQPSETEIRLDKERAQRRALLEETRAKRDEQAAVDTEIYKKQINITFDHYGYMTDPGKQRMMESGEPKNSKEKKSPAESNAVWLRLRNDSPLPISVPTQSMYLPNPQCFFEFSAGNKIIGLCDEREIGVWFGVVNQKGTPIPYGFDFGASSILLPKTSALFAVPRAILEKGNAIRFEFTFKKDDGPGKIGDYGTPKPLKFRAVDLPLIY